MEDKLKKFVNENRQAFDRHQPSPLVWDRIKQNLPQQADVAAEEEQEQQSTPVKRMRPARIWYAAASIVAVLMVSGIIWKQLNSSDDVANESDVSRLAQQEKLKGHSIESLEQEPLKPSTNGAGKDELLYEIDARTAKVTTNKVDKGHSIRNKQDMPSEEIDPMERSYALLADESSAINRMEGVLQLASMDYIPDAGMVKIQEMMGSDPNENIRLAAYDIFMEHAPAEQKGQQIQEAFLQQNDPAMQVELMQAMAGTNALQINDATTKRLEAIVDDPLAIDLVKDQAYAVLMKNW